MDATLQRFTLLLLILATPGVLHAQQTAAPAATLAQADRHLAQGDHAAAEAMYRSLIASAPETPGAYLGLGRIAMAEGDWQEAATWLAQGIERDPGHIELRYYRAIGHREIARHQGLLDRAHWGQAEEQFSWILERDSLYRDVLYQYALLRDADDRHEDALLLGLRQIRLKPDLAAAQRGLFRLFRRFINHTEPDAALAWAADHPSGYAAYFTGEIFRLQGDPDRADSVFIDLLSRRMEFPRQPVLLSRAKIQYALGRPADGQLFVDQAITEITSPDDAAYLFDEFKYVVTEEELARYRTLSTAEELQSFFQVFWTRRNPTPAAAVNPRLTEHYRRLSVAEEDYPYDGLRAWLNDPDKMQELDLPEAYRLNEEFNDKGLVYIRHGEPADRIATVTGDMDFFRSNPDAPVSGVSRDMTLSTGWVPNESWRYANPQIDFHFVIDEGGGENNWRLAPVLTNPAMLEDREMWGGIYVRLARAARTLDFTAEEDPEEIAEEERSESSETLSPGVSADAAMAERVESIQERMRDPFDQAPENVNAAIQDAVQYREMMAEESREYVTLGLTTDRHTWAEEVQPLDVPYVLAAFRGEEGETDLEVHFALPIGQLTQEVGSQGTIDIEVACGLYGMDWLTIQQQTDVKRLVPVPDEEAAVIDYCELTAPPDSYRVAFHNRPVQTNRLGGYNFGYRIPDFSDGILAVSDILPATSITPTLGPSRYNKGDLYVRVNPFGRFSTREPVFLYFEIYNLTFGADDRTSYAVEYILTPEEARRGILGLGRGGQRPALSLKTEHAGTTAAPAEYTQIDAASVAPGRYTLTVRVTDTHTGATGERSRTVEFYR